MTLREQVLRIFEQEDINFLLTNRIPRRLATQFIGWFSRIEQPLVRDLSIAAWRFFAHLPLNGATKEEFKNPHDCFLFQIQDGGRPPAHHEELPVVPPRPAVADLR